MDHLVIDTSAGSIGFVGRLWTDRPRPALLVVAGAFPDPGQHHEIVDWFPQSTVLVANLPGMGGMPWSAADAPALSKGLGEAIGVVLGGRPLVLCGISASCLATLPLQAANIRRKILIEPFLTTGGLWPFLAYGRHLLTLNPGHERLRAYLWTMFGFGETTAESRDYRHLAEAIDVPTDVVVGGMPLAPERTEPYFPSLASVADRAIFAAHPKVTLHEGPPAAGHDVWIDPQTSALIRRLMGDSLKSLVADPLVAASPTA